MPSLLFSFLLASFASAAERGPSWKFDFGSGAAAPGFTPVKADTLFTAERGYGFEPGATLQDVDRGGDALRGDFVTSGQPFKFSVTVPEGNFRVTVTLGDATGESTTTVKAEARRLMLEHVRTAAGQFATRTFTVNVRTPQLPPGNTLKLDTREWDAVAHRAVTLTWDDRLTLQFSDERPCVCAVEIEKIDDAITVFLLGDSTVTDQPNEPGGTWGQHLPRWFKPSVAIANHAESGQTLKSFRTQRRWEKVMLALKPGDYVFMQFGHNDLNKTGHDAIWPREDLLGDWVHTHSDANTEFIWLLAAYAVEVKRRGGMPVIVSPITKTNLRTGELNTAGLGDYPGAARKAAELANAAFIDLNGMTADVVRALGPTLAPKAYADGTHGSTYGGYLFARCVVEGIRHARLDLAAHLANDTGSFDVKAPRPMPDEFKIPADPRVPLPAPPGFPPRTGSPTKGDAATPATK